MSPVASKTLGRLGVTFKIYLILCLVSVSKSSEFVAFPRNRCGSISTKVSSSIRIPESHGISHLHPSRLFTQRDGL
uniref:Putative secreted protein n=1 Tax=Panstrongylus lignarius TaxID=156445 RepID=A0A224Y3V5_9HEMI